MVDVDSLSDAELRAKLEEFGFPVMPITGTTRKVMAKKLKMLLENRQKIGKDNHRSLGRYSSEDESDSDSKVAAKQAKQKRQTMAAPLMQPPLSTQRVSTRKSPSRNDSPAPLVSGNSPNQREIKTVKTSVSSRTTKIVKAANQYDVDNYSDSEEGGEEFDPVTPSPSTSYKRESPVKLSEPRSRYTIGSSKSPATSPLSPGRLPTSYLSAASAADAASDRLAQIRNRSTIYNSSVDGKPLYTSSPTEDPIQDKENTPFLSNFTRRLSQLNSESPRTTYDFKNDIIKENDANGSGGSSRNYLKNYRSSIMTGRTSSYDYRAPLSQNSSIFKNSYVPLIVLIVAFLFFTVIAMVYMGIRFGTPLPVESIGAVMPLCNKADPTSERFVNCLVEGEGRAALNMLKVVRPELDRRAVLNACVDSKAKPYMTEQDVLSFLKEYYLAKDETRIDTDLKNLEVLACLNPSWDISIIQFEKDGDEVRKGVIESNMKIINTNRNTKITAFLVRHPSVPWKCSIYNTTSTVLSYLITVFGGIMVMYALNYGYKFYYQAMERQREEDVAMVENIIDVLQSNCNDEDNDFLVINHVRDMIIPIGERNSKEKTWARAIKYINENESRIRTEVQVVRGEPYEVWRWLGGSNSNSSKNKSWQGQAFETQVGSVNSLPCSPTPCLKIRGMVKEGDRNTQVIKKSVLSKCASQCKILHCAVDTSSNCVYLKCADPSDAAIAYRNLHGWWYAGNLVTVKYLRLERYMQRFPDSPVSGPPYLK